jgi:hypothetical protein
VPIKDQDPVAANSGWAVMVSRDADAARKLNALSGMIDELIDMEPDPVRPFPSLYNPDSCVFELAFSRSGSQDPAAMDVLEFLEWLDRATMDELLRFGSRP